MTRPGERLANRQLASEIGSRLNLSVRLEDLSWIDGLSEGQVKFKLALRAYRVNQLGLSQREFGESLGYKADAATTVVPRWESLRNSRLPAIKVVREMREPLLKMFGGVS